MLHLSSNVTHHAVTMQHQGVVLESQVDKDVTHSLHTVVRFPPVV